MTSRNVWLIDRYGSQIDDVTLSRLSDLLDTIMTADGDEEHRCVSLSDEDGWNLEYYPDRVLLENVEEHGSIVGELREATRAEELAVGADFIEGDIGAVRTHRWR